MSVSNFQHGRATIVIHRPELSKDQQKRQERQIEIALQQFGRAMQESERREGKQCQQAFK